MWEHYSPEDFKMRSKIALTRGVKKERGVDVLCGYIGWLYFCVYLFNYLFVLVAIFRILSNGMASL